MEISTQRRQNIVDALKLEKIHWSGELTAVDFLERIYALELFPSTDSRFENAAGDIWQHTINNDDWDADWVYADSRFGVFKAITPDFLKFICEMVHPVVRPDRTEAEWIVQICNEQLRQEGWQLIAQEKIAGRVCYVASRVDSAGDRSISRARAVADTLSAAWMQQEIERLENSVERDPALAVGTAKDLIETCCKTILSNRGVQTTPSELPKLTKLLAKELQLVPEGISDEAKGAEGIKKILGNLSAITQNLAELRNLYGTGHGRDGKHRGLQPRHARLAVGCAVAFVDFIAATDRVRSEREK